MKEKSLIPLEKRDFGKRDLPSKCVLWVEESLLEEIEDSLPKLENIQM